MVLNPGTKSIDFTRHSAKSGVLVFGWVLGWGLGWGLGVMGRVVIECI